MCRYDSFSSTAEAYLIPLADRRLLLHPKVSLKQWRRVVNIIGHWPTTRFNILKKNTLCSVINLSCIRWAYVHPGFSYIHPEHTHSVCHTESQP